MLAPCYCLLWSFASASRTRRNRRSERRRDCSGGTGSWRSTHTMFLLLSPMNCPPLRRVNHPLKRLVHALIHCIALES
ncbi:hypothetical protein EV421DRAFT_1837545 [Armillaria borealis]|uniref:Uncharacterized protein n=1 Tax=Armillaria borealis TaxID=47425 RepID=A0AA39J661_9AGAR|nr:hypothetical protein EV421DRAFT_1837545 [Armillaria borealis]